MPSTLHNHINLQQLIIILKTGSTDTVKIHDMTSYKPPGGNPIAVKYISYHIKTITFIFTAMRTSKSHMITLLTRDTHLMQQFIYYYKQLYMFRASICPSSGVLGCIRIMLLHMAFSTVKENCALVGCCNGCMCIVQI